MKSVKRTAEEDSPSKVRENKKAKRKTYKSKIEEFADITVEEALREVEWFYMCVRNLFFFNIKSVTLG